MKASTTAAVLLLLIRSHCLAQPSPAPVFDTHLHCHPADVNGPPPLGVCAAAAELPAWDPAESWPIASTRWQKNPE